MKTDTTSRNWGGPREGSGRKPKSEHGNAVRISITLPPELAGKIKREAKRLARPVSTVIERRIMRGYKIQRS